jgi:hypothetical protein
MKSIGMMLLLAGLSSLAVAGGFDPVPEIGAASGVAVLALVSGALLVIRGRRRK